MVSRCLYTLTIATLFALSVSATSPVDIADCSTTAQTDKWVRITNGAMWKDTDGNEVQAHGAGFLYHEGRFYMIGEDRTGSWHPDVNMYSSDDLVNWRFENKIIANGKTHPDLGSTRMIERPKLMYNAKTGKFVVWCHWEASNYGASEAGVFYSDKINGDYVFYSGNRPLGIKSRDCNVFVDDDGTAYFISTTSENTNLGLFRLSDDYLEPVEHTVLFEGKRREAPAIVKHNGKYYMLSSACSGWDPNPCQLSTSENIMTGWTSLKNIGNPIAFDTQAASIIKIKGTKATTYLYVGDRWMDSDLPESKTVIFPITFTENNCNFVYEPEFEINFHTGEWRRVDNSDMALPKDNWSVVDCSSEELVKENSPASNVFDNDITTIWHTRYSSESGSAPHRLTIDMGVTSPISGFLITPRSDSGSTNGLIREFAFQISMDGKIWDTVSAGSWLPYWSKVNFASVSARYFRIIALNGDYASIAEIDLYTKSEPYQIREITPKYRIGKGTPYVEGTSIDVSSGSKLILAPESDCYGCWAIEYPDGHIVSQQKINVNPVTSEHSGVYNVFFLDMYNNTHKLSYTVNVDTSGIDDTAVNEIVYRREYFSVDGVAVINPTPGTFYICREYYPNMNYRTIKTIMK